MARTGLRMMPTFPSPPLKFRTARFPQYGFKASMSDRAFVQVHSLKPAPDIRCYLAVCFYPSHAFTSEEVLALCPRLSGLPRAAVREAFPPYPGVLGSGSSCAVSNHPRLLLPHAPVSQAGCDFTLLRLYVAPSLCGSAEATRETFPTFTAVLSMHAIDPTPVVHRALPLCSHDASRLSRIITESSNHNARLCQQSPTG